MYVPSLPGPIGKPVPTTEAAPIFGARRHHYRCVGNDPHSAIDDDAGPASHSHGTAERPCQDRRENQRGAEQGPRRRPCQTGTFLHDRDFMATSIQSLPFSAWTATPKRGPPPGA